MKLWWCTLFSMGFTLENKTAWYFVISDKTIQTWITCVLTHNIPYSSNR
jgi:hypothetical protein